MFADYTDELQDEIYLLKAEIEKYKAFVRAYRHHEANIGNGPAAIVARVKMEAADAALGEV